MDSVALRAPAATAAVGARVAAAMGLSFSAHQAYPNVNRIASAGWMILR